MSWRWYRRLRLFGGISANFSKTGVGWSWGFWGFRIGKSSNGRTWISIGIPGTGIRYFKYLKSSTRYHNYQQTNSRLDDEIQSELPSRDKVNNPKISNWKNLK